MKPSPLLLCIIFSLSLSSVSAQQITTIGTQWSSSWIIYNVPAGDHNLSAEISAFAFMRWGSHLLLVPEIGIRQWDQILGDIQVNSFQFRSRSVHLKLNMLLPFSKSYHDTQQGGFASVGFSQNLRYHFLSQNWENGEVISQTEGMENSREGDAHIGAGYSSPFLQHFTLLVRGEYGLGFHQGPRFRRNELSVTVGLGVQLK